jgi:hypothetical protein
MQFGIVDFAFPAELAAARLGVSKCVERRSCNGPGGDVVAIVQFGAIRVDEESVSR